MIVIALLFMCNYGNYFLSTYHTEPAWNIATGNQRGLNSREKYTQQRAGWSVVRGRGRLSGRKRWTVWEPVTQVVCRRCSKSDR